MRKFHVESSRRFFVIYARISGGEHGHPYGHIEGSGKVDSQIRLVRQKTRRLRRQLGFKDQDVVVLWDKCQRPKDARELGQLTKMLEDAEVGYLAVTNAGRLSDTVNGLGALFLDYVAAGLQVFVVDDPLIDPTKAVDTVSLKQAFERRATTYAKQGQSRQNNQSTKLRKQRLPACFTLVSGRAVVHPTAFHRVLFPVFLAEQKVIAETLLHNEKLSKSEIARRVAKRLNGHHSYRGHTWTARNVLVKLANSAFRRFFFRHYGPMLRKRRRSGTRLSEMCRLGRKTPGKWPNLLSEVENDVQLLNST